MAQKKAHEVEGWLKRPPEDVRIVLFYGPDRGLVSERARRFADWTGLSLDDPFSVVRLDAAEIDREPGRLLDEARALSMFSQRRLVWVRGASNQKGLADQVATLAADPPPDTFVLVEAGDLKKGAALRAAVEPAAAAMALPCYADEGRTLDALIDAEMQAVGVTITLEARQALRQSLGGDRLATRVEIEKLLLYVRGRPRIELEDVVAATGDSAALSVDEVVDAALDGRLDAFETAYARLTAAGGQTYPVLAAALRQFQSLQAMAGSMEKEGRSPAAAVASARPPVFFSRRGTVENALRRWGAADAGRIATRLHEAVLQTRRRPDLAEAVTRHTLLAIALDGGRRR